MCPSGDIIISNEDHNIALCFFLFFFFYDTTPTDIYSLSLHDALPISHELRRPLPVSQPASGFLSARRRDRPRKRSEEHTSELQSRVDLVCRLLLEKKKNGKRDIVDECDKDKVE